MQKNKESFVANKRPLLSSVINSPEQRVRVIKKRRSISIPSDISTTESEDGNGTGLSTYTYYKSEVWKIF